MSSAGSTAHALRGDLALGFRRTTGEQHGEGEQQDEQQFWCEHATHLLSSGFGGGLSGGFVVGVGRIAIAPSCPNGVGSGTPKGTESGLNRA